MKKYFFLDALQANVFLGIYICRDKYKIETYKRRLHEKEPNENIKTEKSKLFDIEYLYTATGAGTHRNNKNQS